jgi:hypothetical protein
MNTVLIGYDLDGPTKDYVGLAEAIEALGRWWHHLDSTWIVKTPLSARSVCSRLTPHIGAADKLFVVDITGGGAAWKGFNGSADTWLQEQL